MFIQTYHKRPNVSHKGMLRKKIEKYLSVYPIQNEGYTVSSLKYKLLIFTIGYVNVGFEVVHRKLRLRRENLNYKIKNHGVMYFVTRPPISTVEKSGLLTQSYSLLFYIRITTVYPHPPTPPSGLPSRHPHSFVVDRNTTLQGPFGLLPLT